MTLTFKQRGEMCLRHVELGSDDSWNVFLSMKELGQHGVGQKIAQTIETGQHRYEATGTGQHRHWATGTGQPRHWTTGTGQHRHVASSFFFLCRVSAASRTEVILSCHGVFVCQDTPSCILHGPATFCPPAGRASHTLQVFFRGKSPGI